MKLIPSVNLVKSSVKIVQIQTSLRHFKELYLMYIFLYGWIMMNT